MRDLTVWYGAPHACWAKATYLSNDMAESTYIGLFCRIPSRVPGCPTVTVPRSYIELGVGSWDSAARVTAETAVAALHGGCVKVDFS